MVFSSIPFLYYLLPIVLIIYYIVPKSLKNLVLLAASLFFYYWGEQLLVLAMLFSSLLDYTCSLFIEKCRAHKYIPKAALTCSILINIGLLAYFKYSDFFIKNITQITGLSISLLNVALPVGISFYTFQTMSCTIDVYRGNIKAQKNPLTFAAYVTLFPQLIAGPIVRYIDVENELNNRKHTIENFSYGIRRFIIGLAKKVLIANTFAELCRAHGASSEKTVLFYWISAIAFTLQIYFDFSGYSDMAIGLGRMFGFKFLENFNYPYTAKSITDFWRRWHISLSTWFRDYVYIPLGGNRVSRLKWVRNIIIVWFLTGFWHGAEWNFIVWGLFYAVLLLSEKLFLNKILNKIPNPAARLYTLLFVILGFVIFNANNLSEALKNTGGLFGAGGIPFSGSESVYYLKSYSPLFIITALASTPVLVKLINKIKVSTAGLKAVNALEPVVLVLLLLWATGCIIDGSYNPFLYFRF